MVAYCIYERGVQITPCMDEVLPVAAEDGRAPPRLRRQALPPAVLAGHPHALVGSPVLMRGIVGIAALLVIAIDGADFVVATFYLPQQLSVQVIEIQVHIAVAVAGQQDVLAADAQATHGLFADILVRPVLDSQLADGAQRIYHIDAQAVLMPVQRTHRHTAGIVSRHNARYVAAGVHRHLQLPRAATLYVIAPHADGSILPTCYRILVGVEAGIVGELAALGPQPLEQRHGVLLDMTLVVAHPHQLPAVGGEHHGTLHAELLLVHPVGNAIDDGVGLAVLRHLHLSIIVKQFHYIDIVRTYESNLQPVGRKQGCLLRPAVRQRRGAVVAHIIQIIACSVRAAVNALHIRLDKQPPTVGTQLVALHGTDGAALHRGGIEQHAHFPTRLERVEHDAPAVVAYLCIRLAVGHRRHGSHAFRPKRTPRHIRQRQSFACHCRQR